MSDLNVCDFRSVSPEIDRKPLTSVERAKISSITQQTKATLKQRMPKCKQMRLSHLRPERAKLNLPDDTKNPISDPERSISNESRGQDKALTPTLHGRSEDNNKTPGGGYKRNSDT